jgi:hypothetical protein
MLSLRPFLVIFLINILVFTVESYKVKTYNLNKFGTSEPQFDCLYTNRTNISIHQEFSFCFRHKQLRASDVWSQVFLGNYHEKWTMVLNMDSGHRYRG